MRVPFWKLQSIGNDFPLIHLDDVEKLSAEKGASVEFLLASLAVQMSDRRFGVGGDGILVLSKDDLRMRMFNPDGSEDFCGNGLRCAAWHANLVGWAGFDFVLKHLDRDVPVQIRDGVVSTTIGIASYEPSEVPHTAGGELFNEVVWSGMDSGMPMTLYGSALSTGSTHVVIPTASLPDDDSFKSVSAKIEVDAMYPEKTSVIWRREVEPMKLEIRIWERAIGETQGCGTGSSAAAADYLRVKQKGGTVDVANPGGTVQISMDAWDQPITISGRAEQVYKGEFIMV